MIVYNFAFLEYVKYTDTHCLTFFNVHRFTGLGFDRVMTGVIVGDFPNGFANEVKGSAVGLISDVNAHF